MNITSFSKIPTCEGIHDGIDNDGIVEGYDIETHYRPAEDIADYGHFIGIVIDDNAVNIETRIPWTMLFKLVEYKQKTETAHEGDG